MIEFAVRIDVTPEFRNAVAEVEEKEWRPLRMEVDGELMDTGQEWAEICFVPNEVGRSKSGPEYRFLAIREPVGQLELPGLGCQQSLLFPTMSFGEQGAYKVFGTVNPRLHHHTGDRHGGKGWSVRETVVETAEISERRLESRF